MKMILEGECVNEFEGRDGSKYYGFLCDDGDRRKSIVNVRALPGKKFELGKVTKLTVAARVQFANEV
jgi:hypothetical protein